MSIIQITLWNREPYAAPAPGSHAVPEK